MEVKISFPLAADGNADLLAQRVQKADHVAEIVLHGRIIHDHDHVEEAVDDGLGNLQDVHLFACQSHADPGDDAGSVFTDDGDDCLAHGTPS